MLYRLATSTKVTADPSSSSRRLRDRLLPLPHGRPYFRSALFPMKPAYRFGVRESPDTGHGRSRQFADLDPAHLALEVDILSRYNLYTRESYDDMVILEIVIAILALALGIVAMGGLYFGLLGCLGVFFTSSIAQGADTFASRRNRSPRIHAPHAVTLTCSIRSTPCTITRAPGTQDSSGSAGH